MSWPGTNRNRKPQPVWRWMILFFFITFVASYGLSKAVAPVGNALVSSFNRGQDTFTGIITDARCLDSPASLTDSACVESYAHSTGVRYGLYDGHTLYVLSDQNIPETYAAHRVRIQGTVHDGVLEVKSINPA